MQDQGYGTPSHGGSHEALVTELMQEVETKRSELENMTMSVVQVRSPCLLAFVNLLALASWLCGLSYSPNALLPWH